MSLTENIFIEKLTIMKTTLANYACSLSFGPQLHRRW